MSAQAALAQTTTADNQPAHSRSFWHNVGRRLLRDRVTMVCAVVLLLIIISALIAPYIFPADPFKTSMVNRLKPPGTPGFMLGTDELGRDMVSRLIYGARLSLFLGISPVLLATLIGGVLGIIAGYAGGVANMVIMRTIDVFYAFPSVLLAVAISGALGTGITNALISLTLVFIPPIARVAESVTTQIRGQDYVDAARATGAGAASIVVNHLLSNVLGPILIYASSLVSVSIVIASGLSFLGLSVRPPEAEWGMMLSSLRSAMYTAPYVAILPGAAIFITSMCFNMMSDGMRSAMDVKV